MPIEKERGSRLDAEHSAVKKMYGTDEWKFKAKFAVQFVVQSFSASEWREKKLGMAPTETPVAIHSIELAT